MKRSSLPSINALVVLLAFCLSACDAILGLDDFRVAGTPDAGLTPPEPCSEVEQEETCSLPDLPSACAEGRRICQPDATWSVCILPSAAVCANLPANSGDVDPTEGSTDCSPGATEPCGPESDAGRCEFGVRRCQSGRWGECEGAVYPGPRDCTSEADLDCDGVPDNTLDGTCRCVPDTSERCDEHIGNDGNGPCTAGQRRCVLAGDSATSDWGPCEGAVGPSAADLCDVLGDDSNCDGTANGPPCPCVLGETRPCGPNTEFGICQRGQTTCDGTVFGACVGAAFAARRDCSSSEDNDCDDRPDNAVDDVCTCIIGERGACGAHPGLDGDGPCRAGTQQCLAGVDNLTSRFGACSGSVGPGPRDSCTIAGDDANCNGVPNDNCICPHCDGDDLVECGIGAAPDRTLMTCALECVRSGQTSSCALPRDIAAGSNHTCVVLAQGEVKCWGDGLFGALGYANEDSIGDNDTPDTVGFVNVGGPVRQIDLGVRHTCALLDSGSVRCWGNDALGVLGYGNVNNNIGDGEAPASVGPVSLGGSVLQVAAGGQHSCALLSTGAVRCWGGGTSGMLGYGNEDSIGDNELPSSVPTVSVGGSVVQLAAGDNHICALLGTGAVRCWGSGALGKLGYGNTNDIGDDEVPSSVPTVSVGGSVVQLAAGDNHTCALLGTGAVRCWGDGVGGKLGYGNTNRIGDNEVPSSVPTVSVGGSVVQIVAGEAHTCALLTTGEVRCWGAGPALGYGNETRIGDNEAPASVGPVNVGASAVRLAAGESHTCAVLVTGAVRCWGRGPDGQLGYGNTNDIGDTETPASVGDVPL